MSMRGQRWLGMICCFLLFTLLFISLHWNLKGGFSASSHQELGMLFFILPGAIASFLSREGRVLKPLVGAMLALPLCLVLVHTLLTPTRSFWQEVAWLCSAVFWTSLGSLCFLLVNFQRRRIRDIKKPAP